MATQTQTEPVAPESVTPTQTPKKTKSAFKGIIKTTTDLKKNVARKLGKGANSQEGQEEYLIPSRMQYLDGLVESLPKIAKVLKRESDMLRDLTEHQKNVLVQTTDFHQQILKDKTENESISANFVENIQLSFCQLHTELSSLETALIESINETSNPVSQISNVPAAKEQYKKWDAARQAVDDASKKLESAKKDKNAKEGRVEQLETDLANAKTAFETVDRDTLAAIETAIERIETEYLTRVKNAYVEGYHRYFQQGQDLLKKVIAQIAETPTPPSEEETNAGEKQASTSSSSLPRSTKAVQKKGRFDSKAMKFGAILALSAAVAIAGYFMRK